MLPINKIALACKKKLDLENISLGDEYYYNSLPFAVIDAIFSIGVTYSSTKKTVENFANYFNFKLYRDNKNSFPPENKQLSIKDFLEIYKKYDSQYFADKIYNNRQRTSTKNGILKSLAVYEFAKVLDVFDINYFQDMQKLKQNSIFVQKIKKITGQASGISLSYFYMLAGDEEHIKPDRMVLRFLKEILDYEPKLDEATELLKATTKELKKEYPLLTPRILDHIIWNYQKKRGV
jgi:hypothetical protein